MKLTSPPRVRCAIYTRKSTDEGLDQAFNSLHAQRDACSAYVLSQAGEGWSALTTQYDDGGFSGGNMERPALKALLGDIAAGKIDIVVVYKIDRLTRSLTDFARMVDVFDKHQVSFVSVTQAFNTTTSMGRLTLNVLLSFAQFEREVTSERIRDKIALSKQRGMWMGANYPLGYDAPTDPTTKALVVNTAEAASVNLIFENYLKLGSVHLLARWLADQGIRSKLRTTKAGKVLGGQPFSRGALFHVLKSRTYLGEIPHKGTSYPGAHPAIVSTELFEKVQARLAENAKAHVDRPVRAQTALLRGKLFDAEGQPMSPSFTYGKNDQVHRYYVSAPLQQGLAVADDEVIRRIPAPQLEALVRDRLAAIAPHLGDVAIKRVDALTHSLEIRLDALALKAFGSGEALVRRVLASIPSGDNAQIGDDTLILTAPIRLRFRGGRTAIVSPDGRPAIRKPAPDKSLISGLRGAHADARSHNLVGDNIRAAVAPKTAYHRWRVRMAFLAPDLQSAIIDGRQNAKLTLETLVHGEIPLAWIDQRRKFA